MDAVETIDDHGVRFDKIDTQFQEMRELFKAADKQLKAIDKELDKLTITMLREFETVSQKLETKANKLDMQRVYDLLDKVIKQQNVDDDERLFAGSQLDRLDRWIHEVADQIGYKLTV